MFANERLWHALCDRLADIAISSLQSQIDNGASAIQLFDSWAGSLSPAQYQRYVFPHSQKVMDAIADTGVPKIHFGVTTGELLPQISAVGADVVGVDWRVPLDAAASGSATERRCRATSTPPSCSPAPSSPARPLGMCFASTTATQATSSTSATASCRQWIPTSSPRS